MTIRDTAALKTAFGTGKTPTAADFGDFIETTIRARNVRPVEHFGAVGVDFTSTVSAPVAAANTAAIQSAIDWSSGTGGAVEFGYGVYGIDGTLTAKSNMILRGQGGHAGHTVIRQINTAWPDVLASTAAVSANVGGASNCIITGLVLDGGWTLKNSGTTGGNWDYLLSSKTQRCLYLASHTSGAEALNRQGAVDTNHFIFDVWFANAAGRGFLMQGRGEAFISKVKASKCAVVGIDMDCPDNWISDFTTSTCGSVGLLVGAGNQRIMNGKCWYIGMCEGEEPLGVGVQFSDSSGVKNCTGVNITTQDTYSAGIQLNGQNLYLNGAIDNAGGGRLEQFGQGWQGTRTRPKVALEMANIRDSSGYISIEGQVDTYKNGVLPNLVHFSSSGCDRNAIEISVNRFNTKYWNSTAVTAVSGYTNAKRHNVVWMNGQLIHGTRTATELGDKAHSVNINKGVGTTVLDSTNNRILVATAVGDTVPWRTMDGTSVITPA